MVCRMRVTRCMSRYADSNWPSFDCWEQMLCGSVNILKLGFDFGLSVETIAMHMDV